MACVSLGKVRFVKLASMFFAKVWVSLVRAFRQAHFFWQSNFLAKSVFGKGSGKFSALAFW